MGEARGALGELTGSPDSPEFFPCRRKPRLQVGRSENSMSQNQTATCIAAKMSTSSTTSKGITSPLSDRSWLGGDQVHATLNHAAVSLSGHQQVWSGHEGMIATMSL